MKKEIVCFNRNNNVFWNSYCIKRRDRENLHKHRAILLWFTGLSGSGKSTLSNVLERKLYEKYISTYVLDGDNIRYGLCCDLKFTCHDRHENLRRIGEISRLMIDAGLVILANFVSPYRLERQMIRSMLPENCFLEIFVDTPLEICEKRDPKGLYKNARSGKIKNFTGIDAPYEYPIHPDVHLNGCESIEILINQLLKIVISKIIIKI